MLDWNVDYNKLRMVALGEKPADLLLVNGKVISVFSGDVLMPMWQLQAPILLV